MKPYLNKYFRTVLFGEILRRVDYLEHTSSMYLSEKLELAEKILDDLLSREEFIQLVSELD